MHTPKTPSHLLLPLLWIVWLLFAITAQTTRAETSAASTVTVDSAQLEDLISTLENDDSRQAFINNLKTLQQNVGRPPAEQGLRIAEMMGVQDMAESLFHQYEDFITRHNLNRSILGKLGLTLITLLCGLLAIGLIRYGRGRLERALTNLQRRYRLSHQRYQTQIRFLYLSALIVSQFSLFYTVLVVWGLADFDSLSGTTGRAIMSTLLNIFTVVVLAFVLWEVCNGLIETALRRAGNGNARRLQTLLPVARNVLLMVFGGVFSLMILSELGIEIMPLLAGAGIVGIAVGFGAQTLVRDFLSGFMVILEDLIRVGDVVTIAGHSGLVEKVTIRKVELRDLEGIIHTVPFSQISIIENRTRDFSCYVLDIAVAYREDTDAVIKVLRQVDESMRADPDIGAHMLEPLEIFGVDRFADSAVIIKGRLKTIPLKQWDIGREFNRRMKQQFDAHNIEIPFPHQTLYFGQDQRGQAPAAHIQLQDNNATT